MAAKRKTARRLPEVQRVRSKPRERNPLRFEYDNGYVHVFKYDPEEGSAAVPKEMNYH